MYIPINFLGAQNDCIECEFSSSFLPSDVTWNQVNDDWAYIKLGRGQSVTFTTQNGVSSNAKILLVGGGAYSTPYFSSTGGSGAGEVVFQDFGVQPNIEYFVSCSDVGGRSTAETGHTATFVQNFNDDAVNRTVIVAAGGGANNQDDGGTSGNGFAGGAAAAAGGGGGGSTGVGQNASGTNGGDGGAGYTIPSPFNSVVGNVIAGGGPGEGSGTDGSYAAGVSPDAYGNGVNSGNGNDGIAFVFLPISGCETGSRASEDFKATGGDVVGTFLSGSVKYKYHAFTQNKTASTGSHLFSVTQGITTEAKTLVIGSGAGSSTQVDSEPAGAGLNAWYQGGGGAGAGGVKFSDNVTIYGRSHIPTVPAGGTKFLSGNEAVVHFWPTFANQGGIADGGGAGAYISDGTFIPPSNNALNGGSGGGGFNKKDNTGASATGVGLGFGGGDTSLFTTVGNTAGAGGGGSAGTGSDTSGTTSPSSDLNRFTRGGLGYNLDGTFWAFLTGSVFTNNSRIAQGGSGSVGYYARIDSTAPAPAITSSANSDSNANDGSGANPTGSPLGGDGIVVITYPISGSISNS